MNTLVQTQALSPEEELWQLYVDAPRVSDDAWKNLNKAAERLDQDPNYQADLIVSKYVAAISAAIQARNINQSLLAKMWGETRQYLSSLLSETRRSNFTVHTMVQLAMLLGKRLKLEVEDAESQPSQLRFDLSPRRTITSADFPELPVAGSYILKTRIQSLSVPQNALSRYTGFSSEAESVVLW